MNCIKCYQEIPDGAKFCPYCGAQRLIRQRQTRSSRRNSDEPVQAAQTEEVPTEPVQAAQTEEVPTEPVQAADRRSFDRAGTADPDRRSPTEPIQPEAASTDHVYQGSSGTGDIYIRTEQLLITEQVRLILIRRQISSMDKSRSDILPEPDALSELVCRRRRSTGTVPCIIYYLYVVLLSSFGIVGIVYAAKINSSMAGNYEEAKNAAKSAKIWIIASAVVGLIVEAIYIIFAFYRRRRRILLLLRCYSRGNTC